MILLNWKFQETKVSKKMIFLPNSQETETKPTINFKRKLFIIVFLVLYIRIKCIVWVWLLLIETIQSISHGIPQPIRNSRLSGIIVKMKDLFRLGLIIVQTGFSQNVKHLGNSCLKSEHHHTPIIHTPIIQYHHRPFLSEFRELLQLPINIILQIISNNFLSIPTLMNQVININISE